MTEKAAKPIVAEGDSISTFQVTAGATGSKFLINIRDNKKFTGIKCSSCTKVKIGMRLEPVFKDEREASLLDIDHFRPSS